MRHLGISLLFLKIIDPFTGHETKGTWPLEYQERFYTYSREIYKEFIDEYNQLITRYDISEGIVNHIDNLKKKEGLTKEVLQFEKDALVELSTI